MVKLKKTKNSTWIMISALAVVVIVCLAVYFYFFYFKNPGLAGMKSWITSAGSSDTLESTLPEGSSVQNEAKPDLSIVEVRVERVDTKADEVTNTGLSPNITNEDSNISTTSEATSTTSEDLNISTTSGSTNTETTTNTSENSNTSTSTTSGSTNTETTTMQSENSNTSVKKSDKIYIGDTVKFDILIKNNGALPAKNIKIIDLPSDKLENIKMAEGSGGSYDPFSRKIVLDIAEIGAGKAINIAFTGIVSNDLNDGDIIENKVTALYKDVSVAEKSTETPVTGLPDYTTTLVKVEDVNGSKIWAKDILKYSVIVKNSGKKAGGSIVLNCPVPTGTGYVDGTTSGSGLKISPNKSLIQFNIGKIEPGAQQEFSFKVFVAEYLTFSSDIKSEFFITDGQEKIYLENPSVTTEAYMFQTVVCMGDSQVVLSDYTAQLGTLLNNQYSHAVFNIIPTGVKGEMANFAIQRFDKDVRIHNPDIIVIGYGCNDAGEPTGLYRYHMDILIRQAISTGAKVVVYGVGYIDMSISKWLGKANYTTFNEILKNDVCPKYGAVYVDLYGPMSKDYKKYIKEDGMHWTEEGATLAAGEIFKAITSVLDSEGRIPTETEE
jgi:uncharacterized repeat protein (TIGR01451 family)